MHQLRPVISIALISILMIPVLVLSQTLERTAFGAHDDPKLTPITAAKSLPTATPDPTQPTDPTAAAQKIRLYYFREATKISTVLNEVAKKDSTLSGLTVQNPTEDELILYGTKKQRDEAWRIIAALDLPRPGVDMEMWGIQISSRKPEQMEQVVPAIREQIDRTQQAVRDTYLQLERLTLAHTQEVNQQFSELLVDHLGYTSALDADRPLALTDILLRMVAAKDPHTSTPDIANEMNHWFKRHQDFFVNPNCSKPPKSRATKIQRDNQPAFRRFFGLRGVAFEADKWADTGDADRIATQGRHLVADFAFSYGWLVHQPQSFSAYRLQQSADALNSRLQVATDALNADLQDMFVTPTLEQIGRIVRCYNDVEYAQVGKVSMATLSGVETVVDAHSISTFSETPPLRLTDLLSKAGEISKSVEPFDPVKNTVGALPLSQVIGLIAAFGENRDLWREMKSGVSVTLTPNVLRNMRSAELKINLTTGDPVVSTAEKNLRPLSRVSQHDVKTSIYVNALDFFDLSAFDNQATLGGGRGYVPIIGPIWKGLFGEIPVAGKLFSWQRSPKTVYTDSVILTDSFITPTAMGIALLYPTALPHKCACEMDYVGNPRENSECRTDMQQRFSPDAVDKMTDAEKKKTQGRILEECFKRQAAEVNKYIGRP